MVAPREIFAAVTFSFELCNRPCPVLSVLIRGSHGIYLISMK
jgi:hypothetical protein